jgi:hypothetical protein
MRYRTNTLGKLNIPPYLETKIITCMNILQTSAQSTISFIIDKSIDIAIEGLKQFEENADDDLKKIFAEIIPQKYEFIKNKNRTTQIKKMRQRHVNHN